MLPPTLLPPWISRRPFSDQRIVADLEVKTGHVYRCIDHCRWSYIGYWLWNDERT